MEKLLTPDEVAEMLGIAKVTLYQMVFYRRIPAVQISRRCLRFRKQDIEKWLRSKEVEQEDRIRPPRIRKQRPSRPDPVVDRIVEQARKEIAGTE